MPEFCRPLSGVKLKKTLYYMLFAVLILSVSQSAFASSTIRAKAWILIDENDSVLISKNSSAKLPPASTVKLVTAMVALDRLEPTTTVTVSKKAKSARSGRPRIQTGEELTVKDLLHLALMKSNNSAAVALAEAAGGSEDAFVGLMNQKVNEIGANDTHFVTASGLPKGKQYTTARDLTTILRKALTYPLIKDILGKKVWMVKTAAGRELFLSNTDNLLWRRSDMIGGKTGFTCNARHCFVGAVDTGKGLLYAAVLGAPSRYRLWQDTSKLADMGEHLQLDGSLDYFGLFARFGSSALTWKSDRTVYQCILGSDAGFEDRPANSLLPFGYSLSPAAENFRLTP